MWLTETLKMNEADKIMHKFWFLGMIVKFIYSKRFFVLQY